MSLNDPQWGRGGGSGSSNDDGRDSDRKPQRPGNDGPPDLDELWRDFNRRLNTLFGRRGGGSSNRPPSGGFGGMRPNGRNAGIGLGAAVAVVALLWLGSGFYIVPEGQVGVVTTFGKYSETASPGFRWRLPWPVQNSELVDILSLRRVEVGTRGRPERLKEALVLSDDENIVDIRFTVQYRLKDARAFLFENRNPDEAVVQAAESAVREIVGRANVDAVLYQERDTLATNLLASVQSQLDRLNTGIQVVNVNVQTVAVPDQVQAAFNDAVKATADRDRFVNEGQAYASDVIPRAQGTAARLREEAEGYRARVVAQAEGDASRFRSVFDEYKKAPSVTRDRLYIDTMQQVFGNTTTVLVDLRQGNQLLYLPFDKLIQQATQDPAAPRVAPPAAPEAPAPAEATRNRDTSLRSRDREAR